MSTSVTVGFTVVFGDSAYQICQLRKILQYVHYFWDREALIPRYCTMMITSYSSYMQISIFFPLQTFSLGNNVILARIMPPMNGTSIRV